MRLWPRRQAGSSLDLLVVGLGNPGREYARNRHNVGALVADELARRHAGFWRGKFSGKLTEIRVEGHKLALLKPETYMNESGRSAGAAAAFFIVRSSSGRWSAGVYPMSAAVPVAGELESPGCRGERGRARGGDRRHPRVRAVARPHRSNVRMQ